jgi:hypothetical protein
VLGASSDGRLRLLDVAGAAQSRELPLTQRPAGIGAQSMQTSQHMAGRPNDSEVQCVALLSRDVWAHASSLC